MRTIFTVLIISLFCLSAVWADQMASNARDDAEPYTGQVVSKLDPNYRAPLESIEMMLYDNGPLVNSPGTGTGGADESVLQNTSLGMTTNGFGNQFLLGYRMTDDFTVTDPNGWTIDSLVFFAYQTGSTLTSTITGIYYQIWNGSPDNPASTVVFGDLTTNRLIHTEWSNIYRRAETTPGNTTRPMMKNTASGGVTLPAGTYWIDYLTDGSLASGPWCAPITINGQTTTGNAMQYTTAWAAANDGGTLTQQGVPFMIYGEIALPYAWTYGTAQYLNVGNPGIANQESDAPGISGWTIAVLGPQSNNLWSPAQEIPFNFEFFGTPVTHYKVSQNGLVTFDTSAVELPDGNRNLSTGILPDLTICGFWDNFTTAPPTSSGDDVRIKVFGTAPHRQLWIKWYSFEMGSISFAYNAIVLEEGSNKIFVVDQYSSTTPTPLLTSTVGLQLDDNVAVQYGDSLISLAGNGSTLPDNDYYEFFPLYAHDYKVNWVSPEFDVFQLGTIYTVQAEVENNSINPETSVPVVLYENGMPTGLQLLVSLNPGEKDTIDFLYTANISGPVVLTVESMLATDQNLGNNTASAGVAVYTPGTIIQQFYLGKAGLSKAISYTLPPTLDTLTFTSDYEVMFVDAELMIDTLIHTWDSDIDMYLIGPDGQRLELSTDNGSSGDNYIGTIFDDQALASITTGVAPMTGFFQPEGYPPGFGKYSGMDPRGDWILEIADDASGDDGTLHQWGMMFTVAINLPYATLPFEEGFNDTTLLGSIPTGWTQIDADGGDEVPGAGWLITQSTNLPLIEGIAYIRNSYLSANASSLIDEWLISPKLLDYQSGMELSFWLNHLTGPWNDSVMVLVSTTDMNPSSFTEIDYLNCNTVWTEYRYNLETYGVTPGSDIYVAFRYYHTSGGSFGNHSNWFGMDYVKVDYVATSAPVILAAHIGGDSQYRSFWVNGSWDASGVYDPNWSGPMVELKDDGVAPDAVAGDAIFTGSTALAIDAVNTYHWWTGSENDDNSFLEDGTGFTVPSANPVYPDTLLVDGNGGINEWVISLPGSFNGWNNSALDMTRNGTRWTAVVPLTPGTYEYKFAVMHQWDAAYGSGGIGTAGANYSLNVVSYGSFLFTFDDADNSQMVEPYVPPIFFDDFEAYTAGIQLALQSGAWTTWSGLPGSGEDPYVSNAHGHSGVNSVVIVQNNDLVKTYGSLTTGKYEIAFYVYIPTGKAGYFNTLSGFTPNPYEWGMECYFDQAPGTGRVLGGSAIAVTFPYPHDTWFSVKVVVDLNLDLAQFFVDDMQIHSWIWTLGASGGGSQLRLDGNDLFGATANDEMYVDDFTLTRLDAPTGIVGPMVEIPTEFALNQNYPNPFNPTTTIKYALKENAQVTLKIYNMLGQEVRTLLNVRQEAGYKQVVWDGLNNFGAPVASGVYIYQIQAGSFVQAHKMILMK